MPASLLPLILPLSLSTSLHLSLPPSLPPLPPISLPPNLPPSYLPTMSIPFHLVCRCPPVSTHPGWQWVSNQGRCSSPKETNWSTSTTGRPENAITYLMQVSIQWCMHVLPFCVPVLCYTCTLCLVRVSVQSRVSKSIQEYPKYPGVSKSIQE